MSQKILESNGRYLQIAFNYDLDQAREIIPQIPYSDKIFIEAGTPLIKRHGAGAISEIKSMWAGKVIADIKTADGAVQEVIMAREQGADGATVLGNSPQETLNLFIQTCQQYNMISMIDMLGVEEPLKVLMKLKQPPDVVILHKGRDEETTKMKSIQYKHINKIKSKFDVSISAAGGINVKDARSAIFNGANIVVANIVTPNDPWEGIPTNEDISQIAKEFLEMIK